MIIIGVDFHPEFEQIASVDTDTGEFQEQRLAHREEAEKFYRGLAATNQKVRVGMEASGHARWFERLLSELQFELWIGDAAEIRAKRVRKRKTDRQDAQLILRLLLEDRFPQIWVPSWVMKWRTENNVRDISKWVPDKNGNPSHPTLFDLKGIGGGGYVVASGSVRANGEVYTVIDDLPVIAVPDWLVDWLGTEITRWNSARRKEQQEHAAKISTLSKSEQSALRKAGNASGFKYPGSEIFPFMNWRAAILASNAVSKKNIQRQLTEELNKDFAGGKAFTESEDGQTKIRRIVASKKLGTVHWDWVGPKRKASLVEGSRITARQTRHGLLVAAIRTFPKSVPAEDGYRRLQRALVGSGFDLSKGKAAEKAVAQVRKVAGYSAQRTKDGWVWVKPTNLHLTTTHIQ